MQGRELHPDWRSGTPAYVDTNTRLGAIQAAYPEWGQTWAQRARLGSTLSRLMAAFQVPRTLQWLGVGCSSLHFLELCGELCLTQRAQWELELWDDVLLMMVAHTVLLEFDREAVRARFRRFLERCCRLDLIHLIQCLGFQPTHAPEVYGAVQHDVFAAFAAFEPLVSQLIAEMGSEGKAKVASAVTRIIKASQMGDCQAMEGAAFAPYGWWLPNVDQYDMPHSDIGPPASYVSDIWDADHDLGFGPGLGLPEPAHRCSLGYIKARYLSKAQRQSRPARGTARRNACISDFAVY